jgi:hypothetical protein
LLPVTSTQVVKLQEALELENLSDDAAIKGAISEQMAVGKAQGLEGLQREVFVLEKVRQSEASLTHPGHFSRRLLQDLGGAASSSYVSGVAQR